MYYSILGKRCSTEMGRISLRIPESTVSTGRTFLPTLRGKYMKNIFFSM